VNETAQDITRSGDARCSCLSLDIYAVIEMVRSLQLAEPSS
jgi:hypothetical protein